MQILSPLGVQWQLPFPSCIFPFRMQTRRMQLPDHTRGRGDRRTEHNPAAAMCSPPSLCEAGTAARPSPTGAGTCCTEPSPARSPLGKGPGPPGAGLPSSLLSPLCPQGLTCPVLSGPRPDLFPEPPASRPAGGTWRPGPHPSHPAEETVGRRKTGWEPRCLGSRSASTSHALAM